MNSLKNIVLKKLDLEYTYPKTKSRVKELSGSFEIPKVRTSSIDIIMPTFNRLRETKRIVDNLYKTADIQFNLIIIDNNSKDGTSDYLLELDQKKTNVNAILMKSNLGGAGSRNEGLKYITSEYVAFLDNDIYIMPGYFKHLLSTLETEDEKVIAVQSKVIMPNGLIQINRPFYEIKDGWIIFQEKDFEKIYDDETTFVNEDCNWLPSGATLWRSSIFNNNKFDTTLGTYYEDNEFSYRLNKSGYKFRNNYNALCLHYSSNFAPDGSSNTYIEGRWNMDAIKIALKKFYEKHNLYLAFGDIEGHCQYLGFMNSEEYINFLTSK